MKEALKRRGRGFPKDLPPGIGMLRNAVDFVRER